MPERKFSVEEELAIRKAIRHTWAAIGDDVEENAFKFTPNKKGPLSVKTMVEVVLDSDFLEKNGHDNMRGGIPKETQELIKRFRELSYAAQKKIARNAFTL